MALPLILLLLGAHPGAPPPRAARMLSARTESVSAVDVSAAQRFGWIDASARRVVAPEPLPRPSQWAATGRAALLRPTFRAEEDALRGWRTEEHGVVRAARWVDALPLKVDAQDGGLTLTVRLRGQ